MNTKTIAVSILIAAAMIAIAIVATGTPDTGGEAAGNNVTVSNGTQTVEILARGGYSPRISTAKAGLPTVLRVKTSGTFDCSAALSIPSLGYRKILAQTASTDIEIPPQSAGSSIQGTCFMGMYGFRIDFN